MHLLLIIPLKSNHNQTYIENYWKNKTYALYYQGQSITLGLTPDVATRTFRHL